MGFSAGRFVCVLIPLLLTLGAIASVAIIFAANKDPGDSLQDIYYFHADTRNFSQTIGGQLGEAINDIEDFTGLNLNSELETSVVEAITEAMKNNYIQDGYSIGLWNYCSGPYDGDNFKPNFCSKKNTNFYFDPVTVWGLDKTAVANSLPDGLTTSLNTYRKVNRWNIIVHIVSLSALTAAFVIGLLAILSRWWSLFVTIVMSVACLFTFIGALMSTIMYSIIKAAFETNLKPYGIYSSLGGRGIALEWISLGFALAASLFWSISVCCCKAKRSSPGYDRNREKEYAPVNNFGQRSVVPEPVTAAPHHGYDTTPSSNSYNHDDAHKGGDSYTAPSYQYDGYDSNAPYHASSNGYSDNNTNTSYGGYNNQQHHYNA